MVWAIGRWNISIPADQQLPSISTHTDTCREVPIIRITWSNFYNRNTFFFQEYIQHPRALSIADKTSYSMLSQVSLEPLRSLFWITLSHWNLEGDHCRWDTFQICQQYEHSNTLYCGSLFDISPIVVPPLSAPVYPLAPVVLHSILPYKML